MNMSVLESDYAEIKIEIGLMSQSLFFYKKIPHEDNFMEELKVCIYLQ